MIPVGAFIAACHHSGNEELDREYHNKVYLEKLNKSREKCNQIAEYLKQTFNIERPIRHFWEFDGEVFELYFYSVNVGIKISFDMLVDIDTEYLKNYAKGLVYKELIKDMERKYLKNGIFQETFR